MARRVSVKGKGADLFFGEDAPRPPAPPAEQQPADSVSPEDAMRVSLPDSTHAVQQASKQARPLDSKTARTHAAKTATQSAAAAAADDALQAIWNDVASQASITNSFRYTSHELSWLEDILYEVSKRHGVKLTKQDVARLGLNLVLWDFKTHGDTSLLSQFAVRRKRQRDGLL